MSSPIPRQRTNSPARRTVLAMVGTDVHRFDRLVEWLERWHAGRDALAPEVRLVVQHGRSRAPRLADAAPFLAHDELQRAMTEADLVVCHGGPATITEARRHGHLPIVVPRDPTRDEHVDDHQQLFSRRLGAAGMVRLAESEADLVAALDRGVADPRTYALSADPGRPDPRVAAATAVGRIVEDLVRTSREPGRRRWWR